LNLSLTLGILYTCAPNDTPPYTIGLEADPQCEITENMEERIPKGGNGCLSEVKGIGMEWGGLPGEKWKAQEGSLN